MPLLFAVTLFVSASLLFMVQPMVGKMILPLLGGSPAVWNACMVFFQALLLLGYLYAHWVSTRFDPRKQGAIHFLVLLGPVVAMGLAVVLGPGAPIAVAEGLAPTGNISPFLSVMALLSVAIGIPFFVSSTSAPLLQKWFAYTGHPSARDPYFLYAASNAGSLISLLGYPLVIEPNLTLAGQAWLWAGGFVVLMGLIVLCGRAAANPIAVPPGGGARVPTTGPTAVSEPPPSPLRIAKWVALAFVPSSWMLGVTFHVSTDIASIPLLWVIPLALYLVTFIISFSTIVPKWFRLLIGNLAPVAILLLVFVITSGIQPGVGVGVTLMLHILTFFAAALMCHYELAHDRPRDINHLTAYFLWMSVGGVLGGLFNSLIAPLLFPLAYEYYVVMVVACLMVPRLTGDAEAPEGARPLILDVAIPLVMAAVFALTTIFMPESSTFVDLIRSISTKLSNVSPQTVSALLLFALPVMVCFFFVDRPLRFALSVAALLAVHLVHDRDNDTVYTERSFFGILKVEDRGVFTRLVHGTTLHGTQVNRYYLVPADAPVPFGSLTPWDVLGLEGAIKAWDPKQEPLTYYHRTGPVGAMFHELRTRKGGADAKADFAMVGLGTGSVSCYALPGQRLTFYEIDPAVRKIVEKPWMRMNPDEVKKGEPEKLGPFTYVDDARNRGATIDFQMGDARLKLKEDVDRKYALLLVDAFSSDAIPVHLLTKQAVQLYLDRMTEDGLLALHISNKFVRLEPVAARIAEELGLASRVWSDDSESRPGKTASSWVVIARKPETLGTLGASVPVQAQAFGTKNQAVLGLLQKYPLETPALDAITREWGGDDGLTIEDFAKRQGWQAAALLETARKYKNAKESLNLAQLTEVTYGRMFHPLDLRSDVRLWTDDYTDVLQVMMLREVQWARRQFGLSTPGLDE